MNTTQITQEARLIFSPQVAKYLLAKNFNIIDIKPHKNDHRATVFIFRNDEGLDQAIHNYRNRI
ncbi:MAG: hypothetical protein APF84_12555 [Gracilibacter sp. BRH_c7a]|nr:MAG: hypothetical protein APF84_12555 [Gracilibacter sp. BRH_c7a]